MLWKACPEEKHLQMWHHMTQSRVYTSQYLTWIIFMLLLVLTSSKLIELLYFWCFTESESHSVMYDSLWPHGLYSPWKSPGQNTGMGSLFPSLGDHLLNPGIEPRSPALQVDSLPAEPQGKPKNTGVGSLLLLQQIFPTQELNRGLLHCRQILYQLSYEGSPYFSLLF